MTELATRAQAFGLIADGVSAGLSAPWRLYLARGCRYLSLSVGDRGEWDAWRTHLGCPELSVRVYDSGSANDEPADAPGRTPPARSDPTRDACSSSELERCVGRYGSC